MTEKGKLADQLLHAQVLVIDTNLCHQDERETCFKTEHAASCFVSNCSTLCLKYLIDRIFPEYFLYYITIRETPVGLTSTSTQRRNATLRWPLCPTAMVNALGMSSSEPIPSTTTTGYEKLLTVSQHFCR